MIKSISTTIPDLRILVSEPFTDERGLFKKVFTQTDFLEMNIDFSPVEMYYSINRKNVIRGMHFQSPPYDHDKIVYVISGRITDVCLDLRQASPTFGSFFSIDLEGSDRSFIFIPKGFAHGFASHEDNTIVHYIQNSGYSKDHDLGVLYNSFGYDWGISNPVISQRDQRFPALQELPPIFGLS